MSNTLGEVIRAVRKRHGITQWFLAQASRCDKSHISLLENGKRHSPTLGTIESIAGALDMKGWQLLLMAEQRPAHPATRIVWQQLWRVHAGVVHGDSPQPVR